MPAQHADPIGLRLPDFVIAGAPRSGTTWLYHLLECHPQIYMARPVTPEPKFFLVDDVYDRGLRYYSAQWFAEVPPDKVAGEKSTNYLESKTAAERLQQHLPQIKLVFILREPGERAYSNYLWSRKNGLEQEDFATALALEEAREASLPERLRYARPHAYFSRGLYAELLQPFFDRFERRNILVLRFEDVRERVSSLAERLHHFLEVELRAQDAQDLGVINASKPEAGPMPTGIRTQLTERYAEPNRRLAALLGDDFAMWSTA